MPKQRRNAQRRPRTRPHDRQLTNLLRDISLNTAQELQYMTPKVKDVKFDRIKRGKNYHFQAAYQPTDISGSTTSEVNGAFSFKLSLIPDSSAYIALFDQYRIVRAHIAFIPVQATPTGGGVSYGNIYTAIDYDDEVPISYTNIMHYDSLSIAPAGRYFERTLTPKVATAIYGGSTFSGYGVSSPWIDVASSSVPYYGLKYSVAIGTQNVRLFTVIVTLDLLFRSTR